MTSFYAWCTIRDKKFDLTFTEVNPLKKMPEIYTFETLAPIFVILFHINIMSISNLYLRYDSYIVLFLTSRLLSFVVPAFIFVSGLKLSRKYTNVRFRYFRFIFNRFAKIYLPYVFWVVIYYFYFIHREFITKLDWSELLRYIRTGELVDHFYFVVVIMQFYVLFPLFLYFCKKTTPRLGIVIAFPLTIAARIWFDTSGIFLSHLVFFIAGCYAGVFYKGFLLWLNHFRKFFYSMYLIFTAAHLTMLFKDVTHRFNYQYRETMTVIFCILSILVFYQICVNLNKSPKKIESGGFLVRNISTASYYIYLSHVLILFEASRQLTYFEIFDPMHRYLIMLVTGIIIPFVVFIPYAKIKEKCQRLVIHVV